MNDAITFTMRLDASDMKKLFGAQMSGGGRGAGRAATMVAAGGGQQSDQEELRKGKNQAQGMATNIKFMSIFKPLAALSLIEKSLGGILRNSQIANAYGSAMGKLFGAAMDILLVPFLPIFNMILAGMTKLIAWLITSGTLEEISKIVARATGYLEAIAHWIVEIWHAISHLNFTGAGKLIAQGVGAAVKTAVTDPKGALGVGAVAVVGAVIANKMLMGIPFMLAKAGFKGVGLGGRVASWGIRGMFGGGAADAAAAGAAGGGQAAGGVAGAAGAGAAGIGMGTVALGLGAGAAAGVGTGLAANYLAGKAGMHGSARTGTVGAAGGAAAGAAIGALIGAPLFGIGALPGALIGAGIGGLVGGGAGIAKGKMDASQGGAGGGNAISNSYNTINVTQNNTFASNVNQKQIADATLQEIQRRTGFKLAVRGGH